MITTIILKCTCSHEAQDILYGKGMRLHNVSQIKGKQGNKAYCTVCATNYQRDKNQKSVSIAEGKVYGMHYSISARLPRIGKTISI